MEKKHECLDERELTALSLETTSINEITMCNYPFNKMYKHLQLARGWDTVQNSVCFPHGSLANKCLSLKKTETFVLVDAKQ